VNCTIHDFTAHYIFPSESKQYRGQPGRRYPPMSSHKFGTFDFKKENKLKNESFHFCLLIRLFWKPSKSSSSKIEFCGPDINWYEVSGERCRLYTSISHLGKRL